MPKLNEKRRLVLKKALDVAIQKLKDRPGGNSSSAIKALINRKNNLKP